MVHNSKPDYSLIVSIVYYTTNLQLPVNNNNNNYYYEQVNFNVSFAIGANYYYYSIIILLSCCKIDSLNMLCPKHFLWRQIAQQPEPEHCNRHTMWGLINDPEVNYHRRDLQSLCSLVSRLCSG